MKLSLPLVVIALACTVAPSHAIVAGPPETTTYTGTGAVTTTTGSTPASSAYGDPHFLKWNGEIYDVRVVLVLYCAVLCRPHQQHLSLWHSATLLTFVVFSFLVHTKSSMVAATLS